MVVRSKMLIGIVAMLPTSLMAESFLSESDVTYRGDQTARRVCQAVVNDDVESLEFQLRQMRRETLSSYRFGVKSEAIVGSVTCNDMELLTFADEIGARSVSSYLDEGTITMEEVIVSEQR